MNYAIYDSLHIALLLALFVLLASFEATRPRRKLGQPRPGRWFGNVSLAVVNYLLIRAVLGGASFAAAEYASERGWGFLNDVNLGWPVEFVAGLLFLDLMVYLQHVLTHALPFLWRFHMPHHSDLDLDVTTALRFHPVDVFISIVYRIGVVAASGISPWTVLVYELVYCAALLFAHSNVKLFPNADAGLRNVIVTPDFHRVHHSVEPDETRSNFGFVFSWWDKLLGTYREAPMMPHNLMQLGLEDYRQPAGLTLPDLFAMPLRPKLGDYSFRKSE